MAVKLDLEKCVGCSACIPSCPVGAIIEDGGKVKIDAGACIDCGVCPGDCPVEALSM